MFAFFNKRFLLYSCILFAGIALFSSVSYVFAARQINNNYIQQQLMGTAESIKLHVTMEVTGELSLITKMGKSPIIRDYMLNPDDPELSARAFGEFEVFQEHIKTGVAFWVSDADKMFYFTRAEPTRIEPDDPKYYWYNLTLYETEYYNFNINYNDDVDVVNLWVNVPVFVTNDDGSRTAIGMLGTGINLTEVIEVTKAANLERSDKTEVYMFNELHEITNATDFDLILRKVLLEEHLGDVGREAIKNTENLAVNGSQTYIYGDNMYRVSDVASIQGWSLVISHPMSGVLSMDAGVNIVFFGMFALIFMLFVIMNIFAAYSERAMKIKNVELEAASKAKSSFLATMSHEIRTPMNAILGITQIELQQPNHSESSVIAWEKVYASGNSLLAIINDILDMSKIETGKLELINDEYDTASLIQDTVQMNVIRIGDKPIKLIVDVDEKLPSKLFGDELRLKQILNNLLSNAIKYTKEGHVKLSVSHIAQGDSAALQLAVEDTGQGMKKEDAALLFSEYLRFNAEANRSIEGTGLGLNITKSLVTMMDGVIDVQSDFGKGSTFSVTVQQGLPDCPPIGRETSANLSDFTFETHATHLKSTEDAQGSVMPYGKVLVVDDVDTNLYVAAGMMEPYQLHAETVNSGFKALDAVFPTDSDEIKRYDIVFMDHMMPLMDGIETTKKMREGGYDGTIVALTANALVGNAAMFKEQGFDDFLPKPINIKLLDAILKKYIRDKHPEEAAKYASVRTNVVAHTVTPKLLQIFSQDAKKALPALRGYADDVKLFTINAHAMKSALANIGKTDESKTALALETSARENDDGSSINAAEVNAFVAMLESLIAEYDDAGEDVVARNDDEITEDLALLQEQLTVIKDACEEYDEVAVYAALDLLKTKEWKHDTRAAFAEMRDLIYIESDFEGVYVRAETLL